MKPTTIVGIDIGTTKICTLVAEVDGSADIRILGSGIVPSFGMRKGIITNLSEATEAIMASIKEAEKASGYEIVSAYVGLAGSHVNAVNNRGKIMVNHGHRTVMPDHISQALEAAKSISIPSDRQILHVIPRDFMVDEESGIRDPIGMYAQQLAVEAHVVTGATTAINNLVKCVQDAYIQVDALVLEPIASGEAVLSDAEREMGVVLVDIGGGTTDIAIFIEGSIWHTIVLPTGGQQLTNDIAVGLRVSMDDAEAIKIRFGHAQPSQVADDEIVEISGFGSQEHQVISRQFLAEIIQARIEEIFELVFQEIKRTGYDDLLPAGIVLCGGTANLAGIEAVAQQILKLPVRRGTPQHLRGVIDNLNEPAFATSVGLLEWGQHHQPSQPIGRTGNGSIKVPNWLKLFLPG